MEYQRVEGWSAEGWNVECGRESGRVECHGLESGMVKCERVEWWSVEGWRLLSR